MAQALDDVAAANFSVWLDDFVPVFSPAVWPVAPGGAVVRPDDGAIDNRECVTTSALGKALQYHVPQSGRPPATALAMHGVPVAKLLRQVRHGPRLS
jgi:hypothetical protein